MKYYFINISYRGNLDIRALETMAEMKGQGAEYISCSWDPLDEDYVEGFVTMFFWKPADEEDTMVLVENGLFYEQLLNVCKNHIRKFPMRNNYIEDLLSKIKKDLKV